MTIRIIPPSVGVSYEGESGDVKPTGVVINSTFREQDTQAVWITYDGTTWVLKDPTGEVKDSPTENTMLERLKAVETALTAIDTLVGAISASPTENTVLERLKAIETALAALGYEFSIGGVNFNDYSLIKTLWLPSEANSVTKVNFQDGGSDYTVPADHVFIAVKFAGLIEGVDTVARIGEGLEADDIVKDVLSLGVGTGKPCMEDVMGVYAATKYIKARTNHNTNGLKENSALYGIEVSTL